MKRYYRALLSAIVCSACFSHAEQNLLQNGAFEQPLAPAWERRTPEGKTRKIYLKPGGGRQGAAVALENLKPEFTRLRQGHGKNIQAQPGSVVELSAWIRSAADASASTTLQIYCMDQADKITAQPISRPLMGVSDWKRLSVRCQIPPATAYIMAYLQTRDGTGPIYFDDVVLKVKRPPPPEPPPQARVALLSDLADEHPTLVQARTLYVNLVRSTPAQLAQQADTQRALVLYEGKIPGDLWPAARSFAHTGGQLFMDMRAFAQCHQSEALEVQIAPKGKLSILEQMQHGLRVVLPSEATAGFSQGDIMPRFSTPGRSLMVLPGDFRAAGLEVLATAPQGEAGLVRLKLGKGLITACDLLSLREPTTHTVDAYYAFTPVSAALGNPVRFGRYFPEKLDYAGVVAQMRALAEKYPAIKLKDEGASCEGERIWTLNIGNPEAPIYFIYAATHGSEWEPGYGLLALAEYLARGRMDDAIDLKRYQVKLLPILNTSGYTARKRQNINGVDLNRQGELFWDIFKGRDSNGDGVYGPFDYDWKGTAPFSEPATRVFQRIAQDRRIFALLDFHGNTSSTSNKFGIMPLEALPDNEDRCWQMQQIVNLRLRGRHILRQGGEEQASQYILTHMRNNNGTPTILNSASAGRYGLLIEITCGYGNSYGSVLQTDVTCEICRGFFLAFN